MEQIDYTDFDYRVEKFLRNQMTVEEAAAFKVELDTDNEKKQRAHTMALMIKAMNKVGMEQDQLIINAIKDMDETKFRKFAELKPRVMPVWLRVARYVVAACFAGLIVFGGLSYYNYQQTVALGRVAYMQYTPDIDMLGGIRSAGIDDAVVNELNALFYNVKQGDELKYTIAQLEKAYDDALQDKPPYNGYIDDIAWNLAIAYLKRGDSDKPIPLLKNMIERNERYMDIMRPAQELLQKIYEL